MRNCLFAAVLLTAMVLSVPAFAVDAAPQKINYQGVLKDSGGDPVTGTVSITFTIYDAAAGGSVLWQETHSSVAVDEGGFSVVLGEGDLPQALGDGVFDASERYLGIAIGADPELTPRTQMVSVPYSQRVSTVDRATAGTVSGTLDIESAAIKEGQASEAALVVRGDFGDSVAIAPSDNVALRATTDNGEEVLLMSANTSGAAILVTGTDAAKALTRSVEIAPAEGVALRATEQNGDQTVAITSGSSGAEILVTASDAAKAQTRSVQIAPALGTALKVTEQNGDETISLLSQPGGGALEVNASDAAKALSRSVTIAPALGQALRVTEQNGDDVLLLSADENGGAVEVAASDALKATAGSVLINPAQNLALQAKDGNGNVQLQATTDPSGTSIAVYEVAKDANASTKRFELTKDALFFFSADGVEQSFKVDNSGNVYSKGNFIAGQNLSKSAQADEGAWSTVFGFNNVGAGDTSTVSGGYSNVAETRGSTISGGAYNVAGDSLDPLSYTETVGGGASNSAIGRYSTIAGGEGNIVEAEYAAISGGTRDTVVNNYGTIGGGFGHYVGGDAATIAGGYTNRATNGYATVGGGNSNRANGQSSTVTGGQANIADGLWSSIGGGSDNYADDYGSISGGVSNKAYALYASIGGGRYNRAYGQFSVVAGGGGYDPLDSNTTVGHHSTILGGSRNLTSGDYSLAGGRRAKAAHHGAFVWADNTDADFTSERAGQFRVRADGGAKFDDGSSWVDIRDDGTYLIQTSTGANLTLAGVWANTSDRDSKENFRAIDKQSLLEKLAQLEITEWNYKVENDETRHVGPMAQDFYRLFGVGTDEKTISSLDPAGIALVAIQALNERTNQLKQKTDEISEMKAQMAELQTLINQLLEDRR